MRSGTPHVGKIDYPAEAILHGWIVRGVGEAYALKCAALKSKIPDQNESFDAAFAQAGKRLLFQIGELLLGCHAGALSLVGKYIRRKNRFLLTILAVGFFVRAMSTAERRLAAQFLGRIKSKKKAEAARRNGKLGGRPVTKKK